MTHKAISPLRQRMIEDMSVRKFCEKAKHDYVRHVELFAAFPWPLARDSQGRGLATRSGALDGERRAAALLQQCGGGTAFLLPGHTRPPRSGPPAHADQLPEEAATDFKS